MGESRSQSSDSKGYRIGENCSKCGLCREICPAGVITEEEGAVRYRNDRLPLCMKCGQCMCICPTSSAKVDGLSYEEDFFPLSGVKPDMQNFFQLLTSRRSVRNFKDAPVPAHLMEELIEAISYAPPGFTPVKTEIVAVNNPAVIRKALPYMIELYDFLLDKMKNPIARLFIKKETGKKTFRQMESHMVPLMSMRMPALKSGAEDTITRGAQAMILFHANRSGEDIREDVFIAATYCMLAAHALGLGATIMGLIPPAINKKEELRKLFQIPEENEVLTSVILGYPKYKYSRGIRRSLKSVTWI